MVKMTPREARRNTFIVVNLVLLASAAAPAAFVQPAVTRLAWPDVAVFALMFAVFVNTYLIRKFRREGKRRGPDCPVCGSSDVSFGGEVVYKLPGNAWLAVLLTLLYSAVLLVQFPWGQRLVAPSFFERYAAAALVLFPAAQLLSFILTSAWRRLFVNPADMDIRWVCETCRNVWHVDKLAKDDNDEARAPAFTNR